MRDLISEDLSPLKGLQISSRTKEERSLRAKIRMEDSAYQTITDITDICGLRVVCLLDSQVDIVEKIIRRNFTIIEDKSEDKRLAMDPDQFGYLSKHFVVNLSESRSCLDEFSRYKDICFEIQLKTMLQHTWAEIEHDLGYKSKIAVPLPLQRRFFRLASILELADDEFSRLNKDIALYAEEVTKKIKTDSDTTEEILIDKTSLESFVKSSSIVAEIDLDIEKATGFKVDKTYGRSNLDLNILKYFNINTIKDLENQLVTNKNLIVSFARALLDGDEPAELSGGVSIFYLGYVRALTNSQETAIEDYVKFIFVDLDQDVRDRTLAKLKPIKSLIFNKSA